MTAEEYRQRMMQAFRNAGTDELIAVCVLPTEKEFEHLEWLLKNHYKQEPCDDCISRKAVITITDETGALETQTMVKALPRTIPHPKVGHWIWEQYDGSDPVIGKWYCSECNNITIIPSFKTFNMYERFHYCPNCGAKMEEVKE